MTGDSEILDDQLAKKGLRCDRASPPSIIPETKLRERARARLSCQNEQARYPKMLWHNACGMLNAWSS